jgi:HEAT repeat protein
MTTIAYRCCGVFIAAATIAAAIRADESKSMASSKDVNRLIDQLGSDRFEDREQATQQLSQLGKSALPGLKEATNSPDAEVRRRAQQLIQQIEPPPVPALNRPPDRRILPAKTYL